MFDLTEAYLGQVFVHRAGNKTRGEESILSEEPLTLNEQLEQRLIHYFFKGISSDLPFSEFHHAENINLNEAYSFVDEFFTDKTSFYSFSRKIANLLIRTSTHPNIRGGDLFVAEIKNAQLSNIRFESILGVFKSEQKTSFIKLGTLRSSFTASIDTGINPESAEKGVIILPQNGSYRLLIHNNRKLDSVYWSESFLGCIDEDNPKLRTKHSTQAVSAFVRATSSDELSKIEKIESISRLKDYLSTHDIFDINQLTNELGFGESLSNELKKHIRNYESEKHVIISETFQIDKDQASKSKKLLKEQIILDNSIEIKINQEKIKNSSYIEKGYDQEKKMHFYKIYFNDEK